MLTRGGAAFRFQISAHNRSTDGSTLAVGTRAGSSRTTADLGFIMLFNEDQARMQLYLRGLHSPQEGPEPLLRPSIGLSELLAEGPRYGRGHRLRERLRCVLCAFIQAGAETSVTDFEEPEAYLTITLGVGRTRDW